MPLSETHRRYFDCQGQIPGLGLRWNAQKIAAQSGHILIFICVGEGVLLELNDLLESRQLQFVVFEILSDLATLQSNLEDMKIFFLTSNVITDNMFSQFMNMWCRDSVAHDIPDLGDVVAELLPHLGAVTDLHACLCERSKQIVS